jgi:hypothetical protein
MGNKTSATKFLVVASVFTACAGATKPDVPDTETQRKVRTDLEVCNVAAGARCIAPPPSPVERRAPAFLIVARQLEVVALARHARRDVSNARLRVQLGPKRVERAIV